MHGPRLQNTQAMFIKHLETLFAYLTYSIELKRITVERLELQRQVVDREAMTYMYIPDISTFNSNQRRLDMEINDVDVKINTLKTRLSKLETASDEYKRTVQEVNDIVAYYCIEKYYFVMVSTAGKVLNGCYNHMFVFHKKAKGKCDLYNDVRLELDPYANTHYKFTEQDVKHQFSLQTKGKELVMLSREFKLRNILAE